MDRYEQTKKAVLSYIVNRDMGSDEFEYRLRNINQAESIMKLSATLGAGLPLVKSAAGAFNNALGLAGLAMVIPGIAAGTGALLSHKALTEQDMRLAQVNKEKARMKFLTEQLERNYGSQKNQSA